MEMIIFRKGVPHTVAYDSDDQHIIDQYAWNINMHGYVVGRKKGHWKDPQRGMHRIFLGVSDAGNPARIDHKDRNPLNNTRENLRFCTTAENSRNRKPSGKSKYLGVSFHSSYMSDRKTYYPPRPFAGIVVNGKRKLLGYFTTEEDAARAYDAAAIIHHKEFANLNFPEEHPEHFNQ